MRILVLPHPPELTAAAKVSKITVASSWPCTWQVVEVTRLSPTDAVLHKASIRTALAVAASLGQLLLSQLLPASHLQRLKQFQKSPSLAQECCSTTPSFFTQWNNKTEAVAAVNEPFPKICSSKKFQLHPCKVSAGQTTPIPLGKGKIGLPKSITAPQVWVSGSFVGDQLLSHAGPEAPAKIFKQL